ncbi:hypothetical protein AB0F71_10200 [Kitasatospora sp. NPDC028055]|uniref:hypothetical protein n=1 Tax=Kitasatospora sp. NPDC028055 TaxID=3155653 RepID=UPI0033CB2DDA
MFLNSPTPRTDPPPATLQPWLPDDPYGLRLVALGVDFDAVKVPQPLAHSVRTALGRHETSYIEDLLDGSHLWLVAPGSCSSTGSRHLVLSTGWHIAIPGPRCTARRRWNCPWPTLTSARLLQGAIEAASGPTKGR